MLTNQKITTHYGFFEFQDDIYNLCKELEFFSVEDYNNKFSLYDHWPGLRTQNLRLSNPILYIHVLTLLKQRGINIQKYSHIDGYCHIRLNSDEDKDWIHEDETDTALIYISPTNLESGTKFYIYNDNQHFLINEIKFLQNTCLFFETGLLHRSFGNHGTEINNGRMTLNFFMYHK